MKAATERMLNPLAIGVLAALGTAVTPASATEPCGDFGECKVLVEINATDGDIGFHFLMDGDDLIAAELYDPNHDKIFSDKVRGALRDQFLTETFAESAEPLCWEDPDADEDEDIVTLEDFLERWVPGTYEFEGMGEEGEMSAGETDLTFHLPAAPADVDFELEEDDGEFEGEISWSPGDDLGECANYAELGSLVADGILPQHPEAVEVASWEVVLEPDFDDEEEPALAARYNSMKYSVRIPNDPGIEFEVEVPDDYLETLPDDTPIKIEVGAIGTGDNATFSEADGFCVNVDEGCDD